MSFQIGTAAGMGDLLTQFDTFLQKGHSLDPAYTGAGTGTIDNLIGTAASVLETITVTMTSATTFDVAGSVSGALGSGTVGTPFACAVCAFTVSAGGTAWVAADTITCVLTPPWVRTRGNNIGAANAEYIWQAPGNDGARAIYVGLLRFTDTTGDYDNLRCGGFTGFDAGQVFTAQPGACTRPVLPGLRVGTMPYWFIASGRRAIVLVRNSSVYDAVYLGEIQPYWNPGAWPYPVACAGSMSWGTEPSATSTNWRYSYAGAEHTLCGLFSSGPKSIGDYNANALRVRRVDGVWRGFQAAVAYQNASGNVDGFVQPWAEGFDDSRPNLDGTFPLLPVILQEDACVANVPYTHPNTLGELDGVYAVTGFGNAAENIITVNRIAHVVMQNAQRTTKADFCAVKLT